MVREKLAKSAWGEVGRSWGEVGEKNELLQFASEQREYDREVGSVGPDHISVACTSMCASDQKLFDDKVFSV